MAADFEFGPIRAGSRRGISEGGAVRGQKHNYARTKCIFDEASGYYSRTTVSITIICTLSTVFNMINVHLAVRAVHYIYIRKMIGLALVVDRIVHASFCSA